MVTRFSSSSKSPRPILHPTPRHHLLFNGYRQLSPRRLSGRGVKLPLTSVQCQGYEWVGLNLHSPTRLHTAHRNTFTFTLPLRYTGRSRIESLQFIIHEMLNSQPPVHTFQNVTITANVMTHDAHYGREISPSTGQHSFNSSKCNQLRDTFFKRIHQIRFDEKKKSLNPWGNRRMIT
jgi:hypothetical protein